MKLDKDKNITGLSFEGEGCAISLASASILTDILKGRDIQFTKKVSDDFLNMLKNKTKITLNSLSEDQITTISSLSRSKSSLCELSVQQWLGIHSCPH